MKKLSLVMADTDVSYVELVSGFVRASDDGMRFDLKSFSTKERLNEYLQSNSRLDILLVSPELLPDDLSAYEIGLTILLEDERLSQRVDEIPYIFKYQPLNQLRSRLLSLYYERFGKEMTFFGGEKRTSIVTVYAATGGAGKSTLALNMCKQWALQGKNVFYLNLELFNSTPLWFETEARKSSPQILYYVKMAEREQIVSKIETLKRHDPYIKIDYFDFSMSAEEMADLSEDEVELLISGLIETENYDFVVVDVDSSADGRVRAALRCADRVVWVLDNNVFSFAKTAYLLQKEDGLSRNEIDSEKIVFALNRYTGTIASELLKFRFKIDGYLPFVPEWQSIGEARRLLASPTFTKKVMAFMAKDTAAE
ncbi:AAA family ATPase [Numidum massiliense]|uniref:AAA family ATPase n=1 Tax=Numidum massiliense TaxID=1522315 RepID=UPI0006D59265|nr:AAA family ATPase [Numidum massiliense]